jgi:alkylhydroperoxidase family enzyme
MSETGFLRAPEHTAEAQRLFDEDVAEVGYVMNISRLWAYQPATITGLFGLMGEAASAPRLPRRQRAILVAACASTFGDSYCALAWGVKLSKEADAQTAAGVLRGDDDGLSASEKAMAAWARKIALNPGRTRAADVQALRDAGFGDPEIFAITAFVALRIALSTVDNALGARPDAAFRSSAPEAVLDAITFGRPIDDGEDQASADTPRPVEPPRLPASGTCHSRTVVAGA